MSTIQSWAIGLCTTAIGLSLVHILLPDGPLKKTLSVLAALMMFCCLLEPLRSIRELGSGWIEDVSSSAEVPAAVTEIADEQIASVLETALLRDASRLLSAYDVTVKKISVQRDMSRSDSIYIERVTVVFDKRDHPVSSAVYDVLEQEWGVEVEVYYSG